MLAKKIVEPGTIGTAVGKNAFFDKKTTNPHIMLTLKLAYFSCQKWIARIRETMVGTDAVL